MFVDKIRKEKGFTLIELLVVISIISLLSSIITSFVGSSRTKAASAASAEQARQLKNAIVIDSLDGFYAKHNPSTYLARDVDEISQAFGGGSSGSGGSGGSGSGTGGSGSQTNSNFPKVSANITKFTEYYYISNGDRAIDGAGVGYSCLRYSERNSVLPMPTTQKGIIVWRDESMMLWNRNSTVKDGNTKVLMMNPYELFSKTSVSVYHTWEGNFVAGSFLEKANNDNSVYNYPGKPDAPVLVSYAGQAKNPSPSVVVWIDGKGTFFPGSGFWSGDVIHPFRCEEV